ncbi:MAG: ferrous iron transport protein B, partial [Promethearchaeota archaeon]
MSCQGAEDKGILKDRFKITVALAGNANVGKSAIFNQLTGLNQILGNWPGKTVKKAEGSLVFKDYQIKVVDLPGIYSFSTYSIEEIISREYIVNEDLDVVINVIDSTNLERNLFFTYQLLLLGKPVIIALNQFDLLKRQRKDIDYSLMEKILGVPVIPVIAVQGRGVHELIEVAIDLVEKKREYKPIIETFGKEVEASIIKIIDEINKNPLVTEKTCYPARFIAIKLLERDQDMVNKIAPLAINVIEKANKELKILQDIHGEEPGVIISSEIYKIAMKISSEVFKIKKEKKERSVGAFLDSTTTHPFWGYAILFGILAGLYLLIFNIGDLLSGYVDDLFNFLTGLIPSTVSGELWYQIIWDGAVNSFFGAVGSVLPYIFLFYLCIEILQDSGYIPRAAFLMDRVMHLIGVHGKSIIPIILGYGCNVPGCTACRIMETQKERNLSIFVTTLVPCAAVLTIVMGLVGKYLGLGYVLLLYIINFLIIIIVGRVAYKLSGGESSALIIELHQYRVPNVKVILKQTWLKSKEFVHM